MVVHAIIPTLRGLRQEDQKLRPYMYFKNGDIESSKPA
jgi:hypothetical protein